MKRIISVFAICFICVALFTGCVNKSNSSSSALRMYADFEQTLKLATDVVTARYSEPQNNSNNMNLHYFDVVDNIYGDISGRISVLIDASNITVLSGDDHLSYNAEDLSFVKNKNYILILARASVSRVYEKMVLYHLLNEAVIDPDDLSKSTMYCESITKHSPGFDFENSDLNALKAYITEKTADNTVPYDIRQTKIESDKTEEIIALSDEVVKVKIDSFDFKTRTDILSIDMCYCTVTETLKGTLKPGQNITALFFGDTVKEGEEYIAAFKIVNPDVEDAPRSCELTSEHSLFKLSQYNDLKALIQK